MNDGRNEILAGELFAFGSNWRDFVELVDEERIGPCGLRARGDGVVGLRVHPVHEDRCHGSNWISAQIHVLGSSPAQCRRRSRVTA